MSATDEPLVTPGAEDVRASERRAFLRGVSRDALGLAATLVGASTALRAVVLRAAAAPVPDIEIRPTDASGGAYRRDALELSVADRTAGEDTVWSPCPDGAALVRLLALHRVGSGPVLGPLAAWALAGTTRAASGMDSGSRRNALHATSSLLARARPASASLAAALERCRAAWDDETSGAALSVRLDGIGDSLVTELARATSASLAQTVALMAMIPSGEVLVHGAMSARACGEIGTATALFLALRAAGSGRGALVMTSTPSDEGRAVHDDLVANGIPTTLLADAAAASVIGGGRVGATVVQAEWVASDGTVLAPAGSESLAVLAAVHQVPLVVLDVAPVLTAGFDPRGVPRAASLLRPTPDAPPLMDHIPGELVTAVFGGSAL
jgi:methylthioribose-1-phosphate isomerase